MKKPIRIIEILTDQNDASSLYRGAGPNSLLEKTYPEIQFLGYPWNKTLEWSNISRVDIVFMQRPHSEIAVNSMMNCIQMGIPTWVDYDDLLIDIPKDNPAAAGYQKYNRTIKFLLKNATVVSTSTASLMEEVFKHRSPEHPAFVIQNALPHFMHIPEKATSKRGMLWRGSMTHVEDLHEHEHVLINAANFNQMQFDFMGYHPTSMISKLDRCVHYDPTPLMEYFDMLKQRNWSIFVVPLCDNVFNRCKSNIAWIEATCAGAVTVAPGFSEWKRPGIFNYKSSVELNKLITILTSPSESTIELIQVNWQKSANYINERLLLKEVNKTRYELIKSILK